MMTNALAVYEQMNALQTAAQALYTSGYFGDVKTQAQAMVKVMAGAEIGLPPFASMSGIHIVNGKPTLGANLIATLVKNDPRYDYRVKVADNDRCILTWYENGAAVGESSFTMTEANAAGLTGKQTWKAYASDMLFARALTRGARRYAPGIFGGAPVYTPEEVGADMDDDGQIVTVEVVEVQQSASASRAAQPAPPAFDIDNKVAAATAAEFVSLTAQLLEITEAAVKDRMKELGYTSIPGKPDGRVKAFHAIHEYHSPADEAAQDELFGANAVGGGGAYREA